MPTLQMIFRRGQKSVTSEADYLSPMAHPSVFDGELIDREKMVRLANGLDIQDIPPMVSLRVVDESDILNPPQGTGPKGVVFNTPGAIARVVSTQGQEKRMTVSAEDTVPPAGKTVEYLWKVLEGDPGKIVIQPKDGTGAVANIKIGWHGRRPSVATPEVTTDRVDIGVFAKVGKVISAPAFVTIFYQAKE